MDTLFLIIFVNIIVVFFLFLSFLRKLYWKNTMDWMLLNEFYHCNHFIPNSFLFLWSSHMNLSITQPCTSFQSILFHFSSLITNIINHLIVAMIIRYDLIHDCIIITCQIRFHNCVQYSLFHSQNWSQTKLYVFLQIMNHYEYQ